MTASRKRLTVAIALAAGIAGGTAQAADPITFKLGHVDNQASHSGVGVDAFAAEVERLSDGAMKVEGWCHV